VSARGRGETRRIKAAAEAAKTHDEDVFVFKEC
jgi:hypothetical protein